MTAETVATKALATRAALVDLAADLFAEQGYIQTSMRDVAQRASVTTGAIYGHFRNKADLLVEAISVRVSGELEDPATAFTERPDHVETLTRLAKDFRQRRRLRALIVQGAAAAQTDPETRDRLRAEQLSHLRAWIKGYEQHRDRLGIDPGVDIQAAVVYTWAAEVGLGVLEAVGIEPKSAAGWADVHNRLARSCSFGPTGDDSLAAMGDRLEGRVAVVTGAGQGIGKGIARRFAREGCKVVVAEFNEDSGRAAADELAPLGGEGVFVRTDVTDKEQAIACIDAAVDRWGRVDIVVNNAYTGKSGKRMRFEWKLDDDLRRDFDMNVMAAFWTMNAAFPHMRDQGRGSIINICSLNGVNAHMFTLEYNASKEALRAMTRTAAVEWGRHNIRCNVICPGALTEASQRMRAESPAMFDKMLESNPMRRFGDPESDIGGAALLLASDDAGYITGNTLFVGGGTHVNGVPWRMDIPDRLEDF